MFAPDSHSSHTPALPALRRLPIPPRALPDTGLAPWQAARVMAHIADNLEHTVKIDDLAAIARLSTSHFSHAFRRTFGMPPYGYVLTRRMALACDLLETTEEPLAQIALRCGLTDQAHLSRLFKQIVGETPSRWRRRQIVA